MSNCICVDRGEPFDLTKVREVRARKEHQCCECGASILKGDLHEYFRGLFDESWGAYRTCARCLLVRDDFFKCGHIFTMMAEDFQDAHGFDYRDGIPADFTPCGQAAERAS